jgi:hypothetical protein
MADDVVTHVPPDDDRLIATYLWDDTPDRRLDELTEVSDGLLVMHGNGPSSIHGYTPHESVERDVVIDLVADFGRLRDDEGFGIFVRRNAADRYVGLRVAPSRILAISAFDGEEQPIAVGPLAGGMVLHRRRNRISIAAVGPSITLSINGLVATSVLVDPRYIDGYCGLLVEQRHDEPVSVAVEWCQFRRVW